MAQENDIELGRPPRGFVARLGRWGLFALGAVAVLVLIWVWWDWHADAVLQREIDLLHARGEPVVMEDFAAPPVPTEENRAVYWRRAIDAVQVTPELGRYRKLYPPAPPEWMAVEGWAMDANAYALAMAEHARSLPGLNWDRAD
ncbi:MAG TPA: hypothetical protein VMD30_01805, partial [Tepidisphaeraceae bacterium]|nr:hypothetical protein [Tepidisphaeraceae bacterium]